MISLAQPFTLWRLAQSLQLSWRSTASLLGCYYFGRRRMLRRLSWDSVVLDLPKWGKITIRPNNSDISLLSQVFVRQDYRLDAPDVLTILDLGANVGMTALYLSCQFPEAALACVEPSPQNIPLLHKTVRLNGLRARIFEAAIGPEQGRVELYLSPKPDRTSSVRQSRDSLGVIQVPQVSVPHVMDEMGWDRIDLMKVDIEGAEKLVLGQKNEWLRKVRMVMGESHVGVGYSYAELRRDLVQHSFRVETIIGETAEFGATFRAANTRIETPQKPPPTSPLDAGN